VGRGLSIQKAAFSHPPPLFERIDVGSRPSLECLHHDTSTSVTHGRLLGVRELNTLHVDPSWRCRRFMGHALDRATARDVAISGLIRPDRDGGQGGQSERCRRQIRDEKLQMTIVPEAPGGHGRPPMRRRFSIAAYIL
jgi:hypothetical protein